MKKDEIVVQTPDFDMSVFGTKEQLKALKNASFPTLDMNNFLVAMKIAKQYDLDPFAKEIWGWEQSGKTMVVVSYAWYLRIARSQPWFLSIETQPVFEKDEFSIDFDKKLISHKMNTKEQKKNDTPIGAWARIHYKSADGTPQVNVKYVRWDEYARGNVWNTNKSAMITKVAWTVTIREVYGLSGLYIDEEMGRYMNESPEATGVIAKPDLSRLDSLFVKPEVSIDYAILEDEDHTGFNIYQGDTKVDIAQTIEEANEKVEALKNQK